MQELALGQAELRSHWEGVLQPGVLGKAVLHPRHVGRLAKHLEELLPRVMLLLLSSSQNQLTILDHHLTRVLLLHEAQACRNSTCHI